MDAALEEALHALLGAVLKGIGHGLERHVAHGGGEEGALLHGGLVLHIELRAEAAAQKEIRANAHRQRHDEHGGENQLDGELHLRVDLQSIADLVDGAEPILPAQLFADALHMEIHGAAVAEEVGLPDALVDGVAEEGDVGVAHKEQQ